MPKEEVRLVLSRLRRLLRLRNGGNTTDDGKNAVTRGGWIARGLSQRRRFGEVALRDEEPLMMSTENRVKQ